MANEKAVVNKAADDKTLQEVSSHYRMWTEDNEQRMTRKNGWNDITDAYWGRLPLNWPYISHTVIPVLRTSLIEKNGRLLNSKLRGRLIPREGGDTVSAIINNAVLDYQWDNAQDNGSMLTKFEISDIDTRLYGSKYAYIYWKYECDDNGEVIFDGNEMQPLDIRDCGIDPTSSGIKDAKWFQLRTWEKLEDLENQTINGKPLFQNIDKLKRAIMSKDNKKSASRPEYTPRVKEIEGLQDRMGTDEAFPVVKMVTEFRKDRWISFSPDFDVILRDIKNPYKHKRIPIAQLRYYPIQDEPNGESEVEAVIPLWLAIQATVCAYLDEMILKIRPPLKIIENAARIETIQYGPEAQWLVDRQDAIEEMGTSGTALQFFQTTYQVLTSAFNLAMGDLSQGVSNFDPLQGNGQKKTAAEVNATVQQQNSRDQKNQNDMAEFITDIMMMWLSNNKQFMFSDPGEVEHVIRIVGKDRFARLAEAGLADNVLIDGAEQAIQDIVMQMGGNVSDAQIQNLYDSASMPKYPVILNPKEKDLEKIQIKPKMSIEGDYADVSIVPEDLDGTYDYVPDVKSMAIGAGDQLIKARQQAIDRITTNPVVLQLLQGEGYRPKIKELLISDFEGAGLTDAARFFEKIEAPQGATGQMGGPQSVGQVAGLPGVPQTNPGAGVPQPMAGPEQGGIGGGVPQTVFGNVGQGNGVQGGF